MFVLIWATLFFSVRSSNADTGASVGGRRQCSGYPYEFCITLPEGEITAEAGLCLVIPCSFTTSSSFTPQKLVWYKCEPTEEKCSDLDMIFHTNKNNIKIQSGFRGRVSQLEPDVSQRNCSIIINDLKESDSGSYQLRVNGFLNRKSDGFTYSPRATVSIKALSQKPKVVIPPLTEGQQTTLTCTAPGLCSGSDPQITWTWRGAGENGSHITGNITDFKTESLTAVTHNHSSTLSFNASAEHHGTSVTCKVSFTGNAATEETVTLNVTYMKEIRVTGNTSVKEGETVNLTCSVDSFPLLLIVWTKLSDLNIQNGTETNFPNDTLTDLQNDTETYLQQGSGLATLSISNATEDDSGLYICTAKHLNNSWKKNVNVTVIYMREPGITGDTTVKKGSALNLTCSLESFPPSLITWTKLCLNTNLHNGTNLQSNTGSASLIIPNVTAEDSGQYVCTAKHLDTTLTIYADVTVTWFSKISKNSRCEVQSELVTCVCITEGFPLPTIKWPLLKNYTEYSVITTVTNHTVKSTIILTVKDHSNTVVECVSSNENEEAKENLTIQINSLTQEPPDPLLKSVSRLETIIAFLIGVLLSAIICCFAKKCHRKKPNSGNLDETLEMVTSQEDPLIRDGQAVEDDQTHGRKGAEDAAVAAEKTAPVLDSGPKDVEYASIDFSVLKRRSLRQAAKKQETAETEYAEIKKEVKEEREDDGGEEGEMLEGKEERVMTEEDEETKCSVPGEEEGEDMAVYSNVKDIMGEM
uniref:Sialic acid-binding Ig-like lectin 10 n=1 Tax=Seriola lalandi dorsalis TaxID=1841481 RepID=A0A3B4X7L2_SERLL